MDACRCVWLHPVVTVVAVVVVVGGVVVVDVAVVGGVVDAAGHIQLLVVVTSRCWCCW